MKKMNLFKSCIICLWAFCLAFLHFGITAAAAEGEQKELSFNSVVEIEDYQVDEGYIAAGKNANVTLTIHNSNRVSAANSLVVQFTSQSGMIYPAYGSDNQVFVGTLQAGESTTVSFPIIVSSEFTADYADFTCNLIYESGGVKINNSATMILPSDNVSDVVVRNVDVSAHAIKNGKSLLSINYGSNSSDNISDAELVIEGNVSDATKSIKLDTIQAGKYYTKDCNIVFVQTGEQTISITLRYTSSDGEQIEQNLGTYDVTVSEESYSDITGGNGNYALTWIGRLIALAALVTAAIVVSMYIGRR
jgi:hypothetical protein